MPVISNAYYPDTALVRFPTVFQHVMEGVLDFTAALLYAPEYVSDPVAAQNRIIPSEPDQADIVVGDSARYNAMTNGSFPVTAFKYDQPVLQEGRRHGPLARGDAYVSEMGRHIRMWPMQCVVNLLSIFANPYDAEIAQSLIGGEQAVSVSRINVPIQIRKSDTDPVFDIDTTVNIRWELSKGKYASEFEDWLRAGSMWDFHHKATVEYFDFYFEDEIVVEARHIVAGFEMDNVVEKTLIVEFPEVTETNPADNATNVPFDATVQVTFNQSMNAYAVQAAWSILPAVSGAFSWDVRKRVLTFTPTSPLSPTTLYTVTIAATAASRRGPEMGTPYVFSFTSRT